jgi:NifU-like protein involved in Fe-S cluster formation
MTASPYSERVLALFNDLPGSGELPAGAGRAVVGEAEAIDRGAWVRFEARIEGGRVTDCRFRAWGCPHTLASAALACRGLLAADDASSFDAARLARELDVPAEKRGRLLVVEDAGRALLAAAARLE